MQESGRGSVKGFGARRQQGVSVSALPLLLAVGVFAAACAPDEPTPDTSPLTSTPTAALGTRSATLLTSTLFEAVGDTFIRSDLPHSNEGVGPQLSVQAEGTHRALVAFNTISVRNAVTEREVISAQLEFTIAATQGDWGPGGLLAAHALRQTAFEASATWACAWDSVLDNDTSDCSGHLAWDMSGPGELLPYEPEAISTVPISNEQTGVVSFDVTGDVAGVAAGTKATLGWLVKKQDEGEPGAIAFTSRELGPAPRLRVVVEEPEVCTPTAEQDLECNGIDDDCDGEVDEDYTPVVTSCGVGACVAEGTTLCAEGQVEDTCQPGEAAADDATCDGIDADCDGVADEDYAPVLTACGVGGCAAVGTTTCVIGAVLDSCQEGLPSPSDLTCDGVDDDCDGVADEDYPSIATSCGVGACTSGGATSCASGVVVDTCAPGAAASSDATCDGVDDDCDGALDEDFAPTCLGTLARTCVGGGLQDVECSDGDACNGQETCSGLAQCQPGAAPELDDDNPCTADACQPATGVIHVLLAAGTACGEYRECSAAGQCDSFLPADPAEVAPELTRGAVSFLDSVRYIFDGPDLIQTGVATGTLSERSAAVIRGRLLDETDQPLPGAVVRVHGRPEFGQTLTRFDGGYDLVVNGGAALTLELEHAGYIAAQRTLAVPWQDYAFVDDVALVPPDTLGAALDFPTTVAQVHLASSVDDERGVRAAAVYVPAGTEAELVHADGSSLPMPALTLRATEFAATDGDGRRLPAELPATTAHAYSVELSADEADVDGAERVELSQPVHLYLENFLERPVGSSIPLGSYERALAQWVGLGNGRVIALLGASGGFAELDIEGEGLAASEAELSAIGIGAEERQVLSDLYDPGTELWRVSVQHLAPFELGFPHRADLGSGGDTPAAPVAPSVLGSDVLAASLTLPGTPITLRYRSDRVPGFRVSRMLDIPATGESVSDMLLGSLIDVRISGQRHFFNLAASPDSAVHFVWDGLDGEGRAAFGQRRAQVRVGSIFLREQLSPSPFENAFAHTSADGVVFESVGDTEIRWSSHARELGHVDGRGLGVGAWFFERHHYFDPVGRVLYRGDGVSVPMGPFDVIDRVAGVPNRGIDSGDGGHALDAGLQSPRAVAVGPDGAFYIGGRFGVRRVDPKTGIITTVAGGKDQTRCNPNLQNGPALDMCLFVRKLDFGRDGALYITDNPIGNDSIDRVRRLDLTTGLIRHVAGAAGACSSGNGDGGPAESARLCDMLSHASAPDGSIYLLDRGGIGVPAAIRKISPNGIIESVSAGSWSSADDSGDIAVGPDGSVFVTRPRIIERIFPTGEVELFAGDPSVAGSSGDGGPATAARFGSGGPSGIMVDAQGRVYVADNGNAQLRMIDQQGIIRRVAGTTPGTPAGDGDSPLSAVLGRGVFRTAVSPDGLIYVATRSNHTVRVLRPAVSVDVTGEIRVVSEDGTETYRFDAEGRHLETLASATNAVIASFGYDADGLLTSISVDGETTQIERDTDGRPTRILSANGETLLDTNDNGYLSHLIAPTGAEATLEYDAGGLLLHRVGFDGSSSSYAYDGEGRLSAP